MFIVFGEEHLLCVILPVCPILSFCLSTWHRCFLLLSFSFSLSLNLLALPSANCLPRQLQAFMMMLNDDQLNSPSLSPSLSLRSFFSETSTPPKRSNRTELILFFIITLSMEKGEQNLINWRQGREGREKGVLQFQTLSSSLTPIFS